MLLFRLSFSWKPAVLTVRFLKLVYGEAKKTNKMLNKEATAHMHTHIHTQNQRESRTVAS